MAGWAHQAGGEIMSVTRMSEVWKHSKQTKVKLLILLSLADRADEDGYCWPGRKDIAKRARCTERYVSDAIREIAADGELVINERTGASHEYIVCVGMTEKEIQETASRRWGGELGSGVKATTRGGESHNKGGVKATSSRTINNHQEASIPPADFSLARAYEQIAGRPASKTMYDYMEDLAKDWDAHTTGLSETHPDKGRAGKEVVIEAMKETYLSINKVHHTYVQKIVDGWIAAGYKTDTRRSSAMTEQAAKVAPSGGVQGV